MKRLLPFVLVAVLALPACAQSRPQAPDVTYDAQLVQELKQLQQATLADTYGLDTCASHLTNNIGPRLSGSPQAAQAVDYMATQARKLGLDVTLEKVTVPHWVRGDEEAELVQYPGQAVATSQKVYVTALGGSIATPPQGITADVVVVKDFDELHALPDSAVKGKIVLFDHQYDREMAEVGQGFPAYGIGVVYRGTGVVEAAKKGAIASLIRSVGFGDRLPHTGSLRYDKDVQKIPGGAVSNEDANTIAILAREGRVRMHLVLTPKTLADVESANVIADLKGSEYPEQIVIVSGHLDSWDLGTGAIDDAAGVCASMQAIEAIKRLGLKPKRTIRFIAWMNEENGLRGGRTYAKDHKDDAANHVAAIEADNGTGHAVGLEAAVVPEALPTLQPLMDLLTDSGAGILERTDGTEADISPMYDLGVPSFGPMVDQRSYFNYHHTAADTFDKIEPKHLAEISTVVAMTAYTLANLPEPLPRKQVER